MTPRTARCEPGEARSRAAKASEFLEAALVLEGAPNATVTLLVHAAIAASDAICCARLGRRSRSGDHGDAVALLAEVSPAGRELSAALQVVLAVKSRAAYSAISMKDADVKNVTRRARRLVDEARRL